MLHTQKSISKVKSRGEINKVKSIVGSVVGGILVGGRWNFGQRLTLSVLLLLLIEVRLG